jgi:RNA polymerase sigma factor (TIGR02999 family)
MPTECLSYQANPVDRDSEGVCDQVTRYLVAWKSGNSNARDAVIAMLYPDLCRLAAGYLRRERDDINLQPTVLVHETYLRMVAQRLPDWESPSHFFGVASHIMRQILVDHARSNQREKRGSGQRPAPLDDFPHATTSQDSQLLALNEALHALAQLDSRAHQIVELRRFEGLTIKETAEALGISVATVARQQGVAEAWLHREISANRC